MHVGPWLDPALPVYTPDPVARQHPANRRCVAWLLALPGQDGGPRWYDLMGLHHGALTSMGTSAQGWRPSSLLGAALAFDGSGGYASADIGPALTGDVTARAVIYSANWGAVNAYQGVLARRTAGNGPAEFGINFNPGTNTSQFYQADVSGSYSTAAFAGLPAAGRWTSVACTRSGGTASLLFDGVPVASSSVPAAGTAAVPMTVGVSFAGANEPLTGRIAEVKVWSRALSAAELAEDWRLCRAGHPGSLNRVGSRVSIMAIPAGSTIHPWWLYATQQVIGAPGNV